MIPPNHRAETLILVNSASPACQEGLQRVLPWLAHLGLPGRTIDLAVQAPPADLASYALMLIAHRSIDPRGTRLGPFGRNRLLEAIRAGAGLVSFDPDFPAAGELEATASPASSPGAALAYSIRAADESHFITKTLQPGEDLQLAGPLRFRPLTGPGEALLTAAGAPLMSLARLGGGRVVRWATSAWMATSVLGPLGGLDSSFWRSLVWAARKPFVLRGLPPLVTMRVDDVAGRGDLFEQTPLYWVHEANRWGFKPWLGLFIYNLTPPAVIELRDLLERGAATAFPHAFGRPPRTLENDFYYYPDALPWRAGDYDEFIYFDHHHKRPWADDEAAHGLSAVDQWYAAHAPLPMSRYAIAHWGEMGVNTIAHVRDRWNADFIGLYNDINQPLDERTLWLVAGPFRKYEKPGSALFDRARYGNRPMYYADFVTFADREFFTCCTEVRDETGYEWAPDNQVSETIGRGVRQLRRALDAMALAVLFTHETDYIWKIHPENWSAIMKGVAAGIAGVTPRLTTLDEAIQVVRATKTSSITQALYDPERQEVTVSLAGQADIATGFYLFARDGEEGRLCHIPAFEGRVEVKA